MLCCSKNKTQNHCCCHSAAKTTLKTNLVGKIYFVFQIVMKESFQFLVGMDYLQVKELVTNYGNDCYCLAEKSLRMTAFACLDPLLIVH